MAEDVFAEPFTYQPSDCFVSHVRDSNFADTDDKNDDACIEDDGLPDVLHDVFATHAWGDVVPADAPVPMLAVTLGVRSTTVRRTYMLPMLTLLWWRIDPRSLRP